MNWTGQRAYARNTDPDTSVEAADAMKDHLGEIEGQVYRLLKTDAISDFGLTVPEIAMALKLPRDTISPRMKALTKRGLIEDSGAKKVPPGHNRSCIIWRVKP